MHCPNCGNESSLDQKFCRKCGFNLEPIGKLVIQGTDADVLELDRAERENLIVRQMFRWIAWGMAALGLGVLMLVTNKYFELGKVFGLMSSLLMLGGTGMAAYGVISSLGKGASPTQKKIIAGTQARLEQADTTRELSSEKIPLSVPSVTERTTQLIGNDAGKAGRE